MGLNSWDKPYMRDNFSLNSGMPRRRWAEIEERLLEMIIEEGILHYSEVAARLDVSIVTAHRYCMKLAQKYPDNLIFRRGELILIKLFGFEDIPLEKQLIALKSKLEAEKQLREEIAQKLEKIAKNHLPHGEYERTIAEIRGLIKKLRKLP